MTSKLGTVGNDTVSGTKLSDFVWGNAGNDVFTGNGGFDVFTGGFGNDSFAVGTGHAVFHGGAGVDTAILAAATDWIVTPQVDYTGATVALRNTATGQQVNLSQVEAVKFGAQTLSILSAAANGSTVTGTAGRDVVWGGDGKDIITTGDGNDYVRGGWGSDRIDTGNGNDVVDEAFQSDWRETSYRDTISTGAGNDTVLAGLRFGGKAKYTIDGGSGTDAVFLSQVYTNPVKLTYNATTKATTFTRDGLASELKLTGVEQVVDAENGRFWTFSQDKWVEGRATKALTGTSLAEIVTGTAGNDTLKGGGGIDRFVGGDGVDTVVLSGHASQYTYNGYYTEDGFFKIKATGYANTPYLEIGKDIEKLQFTNGSGANTTYDVKFIDEDTTGAVFSDNNDFVVANWLPQYATLSMDKGDDYARGNGSVQTLSGGEGNDTIWWANLADNAVVTGGAGHDRIEVQMTSTMASGIVTLDGGTGNDELLYSGYIQARLIGGSGDDRIEASLNTLVEAGSGNDTISGSFWYSGDGKVGAIDGGSGDDVLELEYLSDYFIEKTANAFTLGDAEATQGVTVRNVEMLHFANWAVDLRQEWATSRGTAGNDKAVGTAKVDLMFGAYGTDTLKGYDGNDALAGGRGNDKLYGGNGDDMLDGGEGNDYLSGGAGNDTFFFDFGSENYIGNDTVSGFKAGKGLGDVLAFDMDRSNLGSFEDMLARAAQVGSDVVITLDDHGPTLTGESNNSITLTGVKLGDLRADDFFFF